jgi:glutaredoxin
MNIQLYLWADFTESSFKILKLLDGNKIPFSVHTFGNDESLDEVSHRIGIKVRRLPLVIVDGENIGGYYDLLEFLINKEVINYDGKLLCQKK